MIISNVSKAMGKFRLGIDSLAMSSPRVYGLIGANGSGKSTAAKLIAGIFPPDSGVINSEGLSPQDITMITQKPYMMNDSIYNNLVYPLKIRGIAPNLSVCDEMLSRCGLLDRKRQNARSLSGGEQQKLALCRAMIFRPKLIIADESFTDLDIDSVDSFEEMVLVMQRESPIIWLIISHQMPHIRRLCDYVFFMSAGKIEIHGTPEEIFSSQNTVIRKFLKYEFGDV